MFLIYFFATTKWIIFICVTVSPSASKLRYPSTRRPRGIDCRWYTLIANSPSRKPSKPRTSRGPLLNRSRKRSHGELGSTVSTAHRWNKRRVSTFSLTHLTRCFAPADLPARKTESFLSTHSRSPRVNSRLSERELRAPLVGAYTPVPVGSRMNGGRRCPC